HGDAPQGVAARGRRRQRHACRRPAPPRPFPRASRVMEPGAADLVAGRLQARPGEIAQRARAVRLLTCDVDGVLTDGRVYVDDDGRETKAFHALDGVGIKMLADAGIAVAWITGSSAPAVAHRARLLDVKHVIQNAHDKL